MYAYYMYKNTVTLLGKWYWSIEYCTDQVDRVYYSTSTSTGVQVLAYKYWRISTGG